MKKQNSIDFALLFTVICFFVISLLAVYSGSGQYETQDMFLFRQKTSFLVYRRLWPYGGSCLL